MAKEKTNRISLTLEFYLRGKKKKPQVSFIGTDDFGVPMTAYQDEEQAAAFSDFSTAAYEFCQRMKDHGEFD